VTDQPALADRLNRLVATIHPADRGPFTNDEIAAQCADLGAPISGTYIWQLRTGRRDNPTLKHLEALAAVFAVPAAYFFDDTAGEKIDADLDLLAALRDDDMRHLATQAAQLSTASRANIAALIEHTLGLERGAATDRRAAT
jgi:transcriptional regulator with XRE-family HTH domain